ncbi:hypothetical protein F5I97DRAFT_795955 [Phlebopus sp. FC_14]|nr:hypothetical protein F5I97DRAFT_795955 [Phlebopus sp. FC_14]
MMASLLLYVIMTFEFPLSDLAQHCLPTSVAACLRSRLECHPHWLFYHNDVYGENLSSLSSRTLAKCASFLSDTSEYRRTKAHHVLSILSHFERERVSLGMLTLEELALSDRLGPLVSDVATLLRLPPPICFSDDISCSSFGWTCLPLDDLIQSLQDIPIETISSCILALPSHGRPRSGPLP